MNYLIPANDYNAIRQTAEHYLGEESCAVTLTHYSVWCHTVL